MLMRTVVRLNTKLMNQKALMRMDDGTGEVDGRASICWETELVPLRGLSKRVAIRVSRAIMVAFGSG